MKKNQSKKTFNKKLKEVDRVVKRAHRHAKKSLKQSQGKPASFISVPVWKSLWERLVAKLKHN